jgi:DNA-binding transcriptional LysR family regulator
MAMNDSLVDLVESGFDVAVRIGRLADSSLVARRLAPARIVVCASPAYLAAHGTPQTPDELRTHECLCYSNLLPSEEWRFTEPGGKSRIVEVRGRLRANNGDALRAAALQGVGIVSLPSFIVGEDLKAGTLVQILEPYSARDAAIHAVFPHARHLSPKVRAFVEFLADRFGPEPYWDRP